MEDAIDLRPDRLADEVFGAQKKREVRKEVRKEAWAFGAVSEVADLKPDRLADEILGAGKKKEAVQGAKKSGEEQKAGTPIKSEALKKPAGDKTSAKAASPANDSKAAGDGRRDGQLSAMVAGLSPSVQESLSSAAAWVEKIKAGSPAQEWFEKAKSTVSAPSAGETLVAKDDDGRDGRERKTDRPRKGGVKEEASERTSSQKSSSASLPNPSEWLKKAQAGTLVGKAKALISPSKAGSAQDEASADAKKKKLPGKKARGRKSKERKRDKGKGNGVIGATLILGVVGAAGTYLTQTEVGKKLMDEGKKLADAGGKRLVDGKKFVEGKLDEWQQRRAAGATSRGVVDLEDLEPTVEQSSSSPAVITSENTPTTTARRSSDKAKSDRDDDDLNDVDLVSPLLTARSGDEPLTSDDQPKVKESPVPRLPLFRIFNKKGDNSPSSTDQPSDDGEAEERKRRFWQRRDDVDKEDAEETALDHVAARAAAALEAEVALKAQLEESRRQLSTAQTRQRVLEVAVEEERAAKRSAIERAAKVAAAAELLGLASPRTEAETDEKQGSPSGAVMSVKELIAAANAAASPSPHTAASPPESPSTGTDDLKALKALEKKAREQLERADRALTRAAEQKHSQAEKLERERTRWEQALAETSEKAAAAAEASAKREAELLAMLDEQAAREASLRSELAAALGAAAAAATTASAASDAAAVAAETVAAAEAEEEAARAGANTPPGGLTPRTARVVEAERSADAARREAAAAEKAAKEARTLAHQRQSALETATRAAEAEMEAAKTRAAELQAQLDAAMTAKEGREREHRAEVEAAAADAATAVETVSKAAAADLEKALERERELRAALSAMEAKEAALRAQLAREETSEFDDANTTFGDARSELSDALHTHRSGYSSGAAVLAGLTGGLAGGGSMGGGSMSSTPLGGTPLGTTPRGTTPRGITPRGERTPRSAGNDSIDSALGDSPNMYPGGFNPSLAGGPRADIATQGGPAADQIASTLERVHAEEVAKIRRELEEEREAEIARLKEAHAAEIEKRQSTLSETRAALTETTEHVRELREQHERSAAEARAAEAGMSRAESEIRKAQRVGEAATKALQEAVRLAAMGGVEEGTLRRALHTHGVDVVSENGILTVSEPEVATSGQRTPSLLGSQYGGGARSTRSFGARSGRFSRDGGGSVAGKTVSEAGDYVLSSASTSPADKGQSDEPAGYRRAGSIAPSVSSVGGTSRATEAKSIAELADAIDNSPEMEEFAAAYTGYPKTEKKKKSVIKGVGNMLGLRTKKRK